MPTWHGRALGEETCPACGARYAVTAIDFPFSAPDSFRCPCGRVLREWLGTTHYDYVRTAPAKGA